MSTLKSYFTRSKKGIQNKEVEPVAIRAPQLLKEPVKKNAVKPKKKENKNSILFYLSPQTKSQPEKEIEEEEHITCKIKHTQSFSLLWQDLLDEYNDPLASLYVDEKYAKKEDFIPVTGSPLHSNKRKLKNVYEESDESEEDEHLKKVVIRRKIPFQLPLIEDFYDDDNEDSLQRPLKLKQTPIQSSKTVMQLFL